MSIDSAIARFRARQAAQFSQRADISRPIGETVFDPSAGVSFQPVVALDYDVPCKLNSNDRAGNDVRAAETLLRVIDHEIKFPVGTDIAKGDIVTIVSSVYNPTDVGRSYQVTDVDRREWQIARRCVVEETLTPMLEAESS